MGSTNATRHKQQHVRPGPLYQQQQQPQDGPQIRSQRHKNTFYDSTGITFSDVGRGRRFLNNGVTTGLMYACQQGDVEAVRRIIREQPYQLTLRDRSNKSPLHYCCQSVLKRGAAAQTADLLVMAAPHLIDGRDEDGFTPFHLAVIAGNMQLITFLLANRADVNAVDNESHTVVHWATVCGEIAALRAVLAAYAPVSTPDIHGGYPLHYAAQMCGAEKDRQLNLSILQTLLTQSDINTSVTDGDGRQPLLWAASAGGAHAVLALVKAGASIEAPDRDGLTALHCAASRGHTEVMDTLLTLCGAQVDVIDSNGCTALHYAVTLGHADATALLLAHGANPNRQDRKGRSPAHCGCAKGQSETVRMVASIGAANMWLRNARGDLALHEAAASGRRSLVRWLLDARPSYVNARNNDGRCPLHLAAMNDNADMCKVLLDSGAHVNPLLRTSKNVVMTPLDCALQRGYRTTAKYLQVHGGLSSRKLEGNQVNSQINIKVLQNEEDYGENSSGSEGTVILKDDKEKTRRKSKVKSQEKQLVQEKEISTPLLIHEKGEILNDNADQLIAKTMQQKPKVYEVNITKTTTENSDKSISKDTKVVIKKDSPRKPKSKKKKSKEKTAQVDSPQQSKLKSMEIEIKQTSSTVSTEVLPEKQRNGSEMFVKKVKVDDSKLNIIDTLAQNIEYNAKSIQKEVHLININQNNKAQDQDKTDRSTTDSSKIDDSPQNQLNQLVVEAAVHPSPQTISKQPEEDDLLQSVKSLLEKEIKETMQQFKFDTKQVAESDYSKTVLSLIGELNDVKSQIEIMKKNMDADKNVRVESNLMKEVKIVNDSQEEERNIAEHDEILLKNEEDQVSKKELPEASLSKEMLEEMEVAVQKDVEIAQELIQEKFEPIAENTLSKDTSKMKIEDVVIVDDILQIASKPTPEPDQINEETLNKLPKILPETSKEHIQNKFLKDPLKRDSSVEPNSTDEEPGAVPQDEDEEDDTSSISAVTTRERTQQHKSFTVIGPQQQQVDAHVRVSTGVKTRSRSEEVRLMEKRRSKIPTPIIGGTGTGGLETRRGLSRSERDVSGRRLLDGGNGMRDKMPSLPNLSRRGLKQEGGKRVDGDGNYSDDNRHSISDLEDTFVQDRDIHTSRTKRLQKRRSRSRTSKSAASIRQDGGHSDYESSNIVDSGFEPSPRSVGRTLGQRHKVVSDRNVNMTSVTQSIQTNIRRYHLERKLFQQLLDLKRLQIRSGQHNEHMLVKRAIDHYHRSCAATVGAGRYNSNDYSFKAFEKFLYQSLRKLQLQTNNVDFIKDLPANIPDNPLHCTQSTHRCTHATHAYTGIPCAAYLPKLDHHTIPKIGFDSTECKPSSSFLPNIPRKGDDVTKQGVFLELRHGADKQVISLPTDRLDQNKRYYVTFTVKGQSEEEVVDGKDGGKSVVDSHRHAKSV